MRTSFLSAAILAAVLGAGFAYADEVTGKIKALDDGAQTVTLSDGTVYSFDAQTSRHDVLDGYRTGDEVSIIWTLQGDTKLVSAMSPNFHDSVSGKIAEVNEEAGTVKLANHPTTYTFQNDHNEKLDLSGFKAGDMVSILPGMGDEGRAISSHEIADVAGKVKSVDEGEKTVTLEDGKVFRFESDSHVDLSGFRPGDMVKIEAITVGTNTVAQSISPSGS